MSEMKEYLIKELFASLDRARKEAQEDTTLLNYFEFSCEIGSYYALLNTLEKFFPEAWRKVYAKAEKQRQEVYNDVASLIYRMRKAEILQKIHEIENSDERAELAESGDTEKFYNKIVARIDNLRAKYSDIEEEESECYFEEGEVTDNV